jgi:cytochrome c oxidase accessory protein FixG
MSMDDQDRIAVHEFAPNEVSEIDLYQRREKIYTRKIEGFFQRLRLFSGWPLLLGYLLLPWFNWEGRQSVLFDLPARQFNIFGLTFWPQDFPLLGWLLVIAAWSLFAVTVWAGRVWCGYTCPQTVWTSIFMWIEQYTEGSRNQRIKLDKRDWSREKLLRKAAKHTMWLGVALVTAITFVGYFSPIRELVPKLLTFQPSFWEFIWVGFFTVATYLNAGWLREQVCMYMCPYARFQSVMFDADTLIVSYDSKRGEQRGSRKRNQKQSENSLGDCIDCQLCVQVCPTGIDIRDGLQYQCITCALCIDACNSVMDKMGYEPNLISYTTQNTMEGKPHRVLRPRLIGYIAGVLIMASLFSYTVISRVPLRIDVLRDRNQLFNETSMGQIENVYTLKIMNMDQAPHRFILSVDSPTPLQWVGEKEIKVAAGEVYTLPLRLQAEPEDLDTPGFDFEFVVTNVDNPKATASSESRFIGPTSR